MSEKMEEMLIELRKNRLQIETKISELRQLRKQSVISRNISRIEIDRLIDECNSALENIDMTSIILIRFDTLEIKTTE